MSYSRTAAAVLLCSVTLGACADAARPTAPADIVADASAVACPVRANNSIAKLTACVTLDAVHAHLAALQEIADANGNTRAPATPGFDASADYVAGALTDAGYAVTRQQFSYSSYTVFGANVEQVVPANITYVFGSDFLVMSQSPSADVTAPVTPVDLQLGLGNVSTSGCEAADFAGFPAGNIALIQRGVCTFELKALNAAAAGAVAVIIFNQGNDPSRLGVVGGTLATPTAVTIPVVGTTYDLGVQTAALTPGVVVRVSVNASSGPFTSENILAELPGTPRGQVVMAGAHLDGVTNGPGINDNGSGTAVLLETAIQMARVRPLNTVRFAWWGAHEIGLAGSTHYVTNLTTDELDAIALYLDLHMLASPNFVRFVYDGDGSTFAPAGPDGSGGIE